VDRTSPEPITWHPERQSLLDSSGCHERPGCGDPDGACHEVARRLAILGGRPPKARDAPIRAVRVTSVGPGSGGGQGSVSAVGQGVAALSGGARTRARSERRIHEEVRLFDGRGADHFRDRRPDQVAGATGRGRRRPIPAHRPKARAAVQVALALRNDAPEPFCVLRQAEPYTLAFCGWPLGQRPCVDTLELAERFDAERSRCASGAWRRLASTLSGRRRSSDSVPDA
jgi:hypothetical protein